MAADEPLPPEPEVPAVAEATLLAELAAMTPDERLRWNDRMATTIMELRHGFAAAEADDAARPAGGERR